jgi:hypothetical protein
MDNSIGEELGCPGFLPGNPQGQHTRNKENTAPLDTLVGLIQGYQENRTNN